MSQGIVKIRNVYTFKKPLDKGAKDTLHGGPYVTSDLSRKERN